MFDHNKIEIFLRLASIRHVILVKKIREKSEKLRWSGKVREKPGNLTTCQDVATGGSLSAKFFVDYLVCRTVHSDLPV